MDNLNLPVRPPGEGVKINFITILRIMRQIRKIIKEWKKCAGKRFLGEGEHRSR